MADNSPLLRTIARYLDETMLAQIGRAYANGRLLLVGTSNLDAQTPVIWNIGAIAQSGHPRALDTVQRILLASSAIPGAFAPVLFARDAGRAVLPGTACGRRDFRPALPVSCQRLAVPP